VPVPLSDRFGRSTGVLVGSTGVLAVTAVFTALGGSVPHAIPALLLLVPIAVASGMSGWKVGVPLAIGAAALYALAFIPPVGEIRIGLTEDVFVLITFVLVAVVVSVVAARPKPTAEAAFDGRTLLLHGVSHDLRSPLTTIKAISSDLMASDAAYDDGTRHEMLGRVVEESDRLNRIVGNLLSAGRVQAGALHPHCAPNRPGRGG
jgi:K+-sensing histidine kinase KdpD